MQCFNVNVNSSFQSQYENKNIEEKTVFNQSNLKNMSQQIIVQRDKGGTTTLFICLCENQE
jgi:hypothetical protein